MCGIAGIWHRGGGRVDVDKLAKMTRLLSRRGPDGEGYFVGDRGALGFGHRRLAILDTSSNGHQPMERDGLWMVFNGEAFNFLEIRRELLALGDVFTSETDTEVVLRAYRRWGVHAFERFNGFWAAAIWDPANRELLFVRDRFGVKPLWVARRGDLIAFGSERKCFVAITELDVMPVLAADGQSHEWRGVEHVPPGHAWRFGDKSERLVRWWCMRDHLKVDARESYTESLERYRAMLLDACRIRLRSDVPIASSISGGLDSTSVLSVLGVLARDAAVERRPADWRRAYHVAWPGTVQDESRLAESAAKAAGASFQQINALHYPFSEDDLFDLMGSTESPHIFFASAWVLYRTLGQQGIKVTLDGQGSDEVNAGYLCHVLVQCLSAGSYRSHPLTTLQLARLLNRLHPRDAGWPYVAIPTALALASSTGRRLLACSHYGRRQLRWARAQTDVALPAWLVEDVRELDPLQRFQYLDIHNGRLQRILHCFDLLSMSHGVEIRMPFLDWRLVTFALSLRSDYRLGKGHTKRLLRDAASSFMPSEICYQRSKLSFYAPAREFLENSPKVVAWARSEISDPCEDPIAVTSAAMRRWLTHSWKGWVRDKISAAPTPVALIAAVKT